MKNNKKLKLMALAMAGSLFVIGCTDAAQEDLEDVATTLQDTATSLADDLSSVTADVQLAAGQVLAQIESSDVTDEARAAWDNIGAELTNWYNGLDVDEDALQSEIDTLQAEIDAMGDDASADLTAAWSDFRDAIDRLMDQM